MSARLQRSWPAYDGRNSPLAACAYGMALADFEVVEVELSNQASSRCKAPDELHVAIPKISQGADWPDGQQPSRLAVLPDGNQYGCKSSHPA